MKDNAYKVEASLRGINESLSHQSQLLNRHIGIMRGVYTLGSFTIGVLATVIGFIGKSQGWW